MKDLDISRQFSLSSLLSAAPIGIVVINEDGQIMTVNQRTLEMFGYEEHELIGSILRILLPDEIRDIHVQHRKGFMNDPRTRLMGQGLDLAGQRKDGSRFPIEVGLSYVDTDEGRLAISFVTDITERKQTEQALRETEDRFRSLLAAAPTAIVVINEDGQIVIVNQRTLEMFGYEEHELIGTELSLLLPDEIRDIHVQHRKGFMNDPRTRLMGQGLDLAGQRKDGSRFPIEVGLSYVESNEGRLAISFVTDITERKQTEQALRETEDRFRLIAENMPIPLTITRRTDSVILYANPKYAEMMGEPVDELIGIRATDLYANPDDRDKILEQLKRDGAVHDMEIHAKRPSDGSSAWVTVSVVPMQFEDTPALLGTIFNLTERKAMETALRESEERFRIIAENMPIPILITRLSDSMILYCNPKYGEMLGQPAAELIGMPAANLYHDPADRDRMYKELNRDGVVRDLEIQAIRPADNSLAWESVSIVPIQFEGAPALLGTLFDLTERKEMETALRDSEERFRRAMMFAPFPSMMHAEDGEVIFINKMWTQITGYTHDDIPTIKDWTERAHGTRKAVANKLIEQLYEAGESNVYQGEHEIITRDGQIRYWDFRSTRLGHLPDGRRMALSVATDMTAHHEADTALRTLNEMLARSNTELEQFAYVTAHDLQEPLRSITSYLQMLERRYRDELGEDGARFISRTIIAADRMKTLINDLLTLSRVTTSGKPFKRVDMQAMLNDVVKSLDQLIKESAAVIDAEQLPAIVGDESQLHQLLQNLIANAIKFRREEQPHIQMHATRENDRWLFAVEDNGIGIEAEFFDRIFVIFQRLHTRDEYPGTGVGLAICKKIIERHQGEVWIESQFGQGSTIYFTIPDLTIEEDDDAKS